jgi:glycosyltransferase involved in cell wall biosynthesis
MNASRKKIGLLHYSMPPVVGGVENILAHHARLMTEAGHSVRLIAGRGGDPNGSIPFYHLPLADSRHPDVLAAKMQLDQGIVPAGFEQLVEQIEQELATAVSNLDILIAHNICSLHKNLALTAALRRLCAQPDAPRLIMWHHDFAWTAVNYQTELHPGWPWQLIKEDWPDVQPTHVVVSQWRQHEMIALFHLPADSIHVIPSGLNTGKFLKLEPETAELLTRLSYQEAAPRLLLPVRITRRKNIELAIRTTAALRQIMPQASLIITGPPGPHNPSNQDYFANLRQLRDSLNAQNHIHFLAEQYDHYLPDAVIADLYRLADALILPSREEGFGIPMLEAGLVGLPTFCTDIAPLRELGGENATYFSPDSDPADLAAIVAEKLQNDALYQQRVQIRNHYTWPSIYRQRIAPLLE